MQKELNRIFGTDFKVKIKECQDGGNYQGVFKVNVPSIDITQMGELWKLWLTPNVSNITAKRSGTGITIIVEVN